MTKVRSIALFIAVVTAILSLLVGTRAFGDEVWLDNGDRLSGDVVRMENGVLLLKTPYAGEVSIQWKHVKKIRTDKDVDVILNDKSAVRGIIKTVEEGRGEIKAEKILEPVAFELAQVNIINPRAPEPVLKLSGRVNVGVNKTGGNTDTQAIYGSGEVVARTEKNRYTFGGLVNKAEDDGEKTVDNATVYMKYDHFLSEKFYFVASGSGTKDDFRDLNLRSAVGLGLGYQFFETPIKNLSFEAGPSYVNEDFHVAEDNDYGAGRWAVNFDHYLWQKRLQFFHNHEGLLGFESSDNLVIRSRTGLKIPITARFNSTIQYNWDYDKSPSPGLDDTDTAYLFTLGYDW